MDKLFPYRICYVEDSPIAAEPIKLGMEVLLDAEVDLFETTDKALQVMEERGFGAWQVFILDNRTGYGMMPGIELARKIRSKTTEAIVVSLNSSDMGEIIAFSLERLKGLGIECWHKHTESFLMIAWLADCAKSKRMISRNEWLEGIGEKTVYLTPDFDELRPRERALMLI
ncbi:MAG TPA: hypothetical protein VMW41_05865 [Candidatus Bathyarchaeia archaeon]|nr:hypothetical protein [Candidatus Bathyarchaeia archaeon]